MLLNSSFTKCVKRSNMIVRSVPDKVVSIGKGAATFYNNNDIIPDFLDTYTTLCKSLPVEKCKSIIVIPDIADQVHILDTLRTLSHITYIEKVKGLLLYLMATDDIKTFEVVMNNIIAYNNAIETISSVYESIVN